MPRDLNRKIAPGPCRDVQIGADQLIGALKLITVTALLADGRLFRLLASTGHVASLSAPTARTHNCHMYLICRIN
jgi:hypothetical protein